MHPSILIPQAILRLCRSAFDEKNGREIVNNTIAVIDALYNITQDSDSTWWESEAAIHKTVRDNLPRNWEYKFCHRMDDEKCKLPLTDGWHYLRVSYEDDTIQVTIFACPKKASPAASATSGVKQVMQDFDIEFRTEEKFSFSIDHWHDKDPADVKRSLMLDRIPQASICGFQGRRSAFDLAEHEWLQLAFVFGVARGVMQKYTKSMALGELSPAHLMESEEYAVITSLWDSLSILYDI